MGLLDDKQSEFKKLVLKSQDLPIMFFASEDCNTGNFEYEECFISRVSVEEISLYGDEWVDKEGLEDRIYNNLCYLDMTDEELNKKITEMVAAATSKKAICVFLG